MQEPYVHLGVVDLCEAAHELRVEFLVIVAEQAQRKKPGFKLKPSSFLFPIKV